MRRRRVKDQTKKKRIWFIQKCEGKGNEKELTWEGD